MTELQIPIDQPLMPRSVRPKLPRDEDAEHLLRLCREGRLFELQEWLAAGRSLSVPAHYRQTPLRIAINTEFHSLIEFLLRHENEQSAKDDVLQHACWRRQLPIMQLALEYGASINAVSFQDVIETWDRGLVQVFVERGADLVTNAPFARAFKARIKAVLGIFLDCKRARPDLIEELQQQLDSALRQACQDSDLKWVSLLMWLGANPRSKGIATEDLDSTYGFEDADLQSALQIACRSRVPEILKRLKPDPAVDDLRELMTAAASLYATPECVAYLMRLGADINDKVDGGSTALERCLSNFGWTDAIWEYDSRRVVIPVARLRQPLEALRFLLENGARWTPDDRLIADTRRSLYRLDQDATVAVLDVLRKHDACNDKILDALISTPKMRSILKSVAGWRSEDKRRGLSKSIVTRRRSCPSRTGTPARSVPPSRYDRERLYEEVWTEPTQKVAKRYGVSDVAIAKACASLNIPKPSRGYWAQYVAGQKLPKRPPLPKYGV